MNVPKPFLQSDGVLTTGDCGYGSQKEENMAFVSRTDTFHAHDKMFVTYFEKYGGKKY